MSNYLTESYPPKAKLLAWSELNLNEVESTIAVFRSNSLNDIF